MFVWICMCIYILFYACACVFVSFSLCVSFCVCEVVGVCVWSSICMEVSEWVCLCKHVIFLLGIRNAVFLLIFMIVNGQICVFCCFFVSIWICVLIYVRGCDFEWVRVCSCVCWFRLGLLVYVLMCKEKKYLCVCMLIHVGICIPVCEEGKGKIYKPISMYVCLFWMRLIRFHVYVYIYIYIFKLVCMCYGMYVCFCTFPCVCVCVSVPVGL